MALFSDGAHGAFCAIHIKQVGVGMMWGEVALGRQGGEGDTCGLTSDLGTCCVLRLRPLGPRCCPLALQR